MLPTRHSKGCTTYSTVGAEQTKAFAKPSLGLFTQRTLISAKRQWKMTKYLGTWHSLRLIHSTEEITLLTINARYNYSLCQYPTKVTFELYRPQLSAGRPAERQLSGSEPLFPVLQAGAAASLAERVMELVSIGIIIKESQQEDKSLGSSQTLPLEKPTMQHCRKGNWESCTGRTERRWRLRKRFEYSIQRRRENSRKAGYPL